MSILGDLASELGVDVDTLRTALTSDEQSETLQPTYLTTGTDGTVSANFSGHVHAQGVDINASLGLDLSDTTAPDQIRWIATADGYVVARMIGVDAAGPQAQDLWLQARRRAAETSEVRLEALSSIGASESVLLIQGYDGGARIFAIVGGLAGGIQAVILDKTGKSDFSGWNIAWNGFALQSGFINYSGNVGYGLDGAKAVRFKGEVQCPAAGPASGTLIATLPVGFRPAYRVEAFVQGNVANRHITINASGTVLVGDFVSGGWSPSEVVNFGSVFFPTS